MSGQRIAALMEDKADLSAHGRKSLFVYSHASMESLASTLTGQYQVRLRGPHHLSFESMQQAEAAEQSASEENSTRYLRRLQEDRVAGVLDDQDVAGSNKRVFVVSDPQNDDERRALAAISTSLVTSAINDPHHTVAAFLPVGSTVGEGGVNTDCDPQPQVSALRSLLDTLGVVSFESLDALQSHLLH